MDVRSDNAGEWGTHSRVGRRSRLRRTIAAGLCLAGAILATPYPAGAAEVDLAGVREERLARLTKPDGWLTLIGLHFLREGPNTVGAAPGNDVVLKAGPDRVGTVTLEAGGRIRFVPAPGSGVRVEGREVAAAELTWASSATATRVTFGTASFFVIDRGGRKALRVKDSESPRRTRFVGLEYFPSDPGWRIEAKWEPLPPGSTVPVVNVLGQTSPEPAAGRAVFERGGVRVEMVAIDEGAEAPLFFVFSDGTSGRSTYGGGRHLYAARPTGATIVLDFNRAENPPCAFTPYSTCPVPPKENRLPFAVTAGEKTYQGGPDSP